MNLDMNANDFVIFEQQFVELISEFQVLSTSENNLRELFRNEASKAESSEAEKEEVLREIVQARTEAAVSAARFEQSSKALAAANDDLVNVKKQLELAERTRILFEEKCTELSNKVHKLERENQQFNSLLTAHSTLQRQYVELQERIHNVTEKTQNECTQLENELRRLEKNSNAGVELRERARLAAAAHARERRFAAAELKHLAQELKSAKGKIALEAIKNAELQAKLSKLEGEPINKTNNSEETLRELRATLEAERAGASKLQQALTAAIADKNELIAQIRAFDNAAEDKVRPQSPLENRSNISPIDVFLAE